MIMLTYALETDEEGGIGWSDEEYSNNCPSSRTVWRQIGRDDRMKGLKKSTKFTYCLETDEVDEIVV